MKVPKWLEVRFNPILGRDEYFLPKGFSEHNLAQKQLVPSKNIINADFSDMLGKPLKRKNDNLQSSKKNKNDEFYTLFDDIQKELRHYKDFFKGKVVYLPCDKVFNEGRSEFVNFFTRNFYKWGIKKLIITQYIKGKWFKKEFGLNGLKFEYVCDNRDLRYVDESEFSVTLLEGDGSFSSRECIEIMKECDIVVTNPPFSLFRKFIKQVIDLDKHFIVIGNKNFLACKEIFAYVKSNRIWLGYTMPTDFKTPLKEVEDETKQYVKDGVVYQKLRGLCYWYTNIEHDKRKELFYPQKQRKYNSSDYPKYDNYDAIEVKILNHMPVDYDGVMGVPITFIKEYNPNQFEILGNESDLNIKKGRVYLNGKRLYGRIFIRKKSDSTHI